MAMPGDKSTNPTNPPAPVDGAGAKEGERQGVNPLPPYVIPPQELHLLGWLKNAKSGDRMDLSSLLPPPPPPVGAVEITKETKFFNIRTKYIKEKGTLVILSGGFALTANPLKGIRIYKDNKVAREYNDCWASLLFTLTNKALTKYGYNVFSERWMTCSLPYSDSDVRRLVALVASLINNRINELKDPLFVGCISKTP